MYGLIPPMSILEVAKVLTFGAQKYSPYSWVLVESPRYLDAAYRHLASVSLGEVTDPESRLSHLAHAIANLMFLLERELDKSGALGDKLDSFKDRVEKYNSLLGSDS